MTASEKAWAERWRPTWPKDTFASVARVSDDTDQDVEAYVLHADYPGWRFYVTFSSAGSAVGFKVVAEQDPVTPTVTALLEPERSPRRPADAPAVTARFLRRLPLGEIQEVAREGFFRTTSTMRSAPQLGEHWGRIFADRPRPGRAGRSDRPYAEIAALYVEKLAAESTAKTVVKDLADQMGYSESRIRNVLFTARQRGLLTASPAGKAGGRLTDKALEILRHDNEGGK